MEFCIEKCTKLIMKNEKLEVTEEIEQQNQECTKTIGEKKNHKKLGILNTNIIKQVEIKQRDF